MKKPFNTLVILTSLVIIILLGTSVTLYQKSQNQKKSTRVQQGADQSLAKTPASTPKPVSATIMSDQVKWSPGETHEVAIVFDAIPDPKPAFVTLHMIYNPAILTVIDVETGNLWDNTNILQNEISNDDGEFLLAVGQGFYAEHTGNNTIATITVRVNPDATGKAILNFGPESNIASVGVDHLINLTGEPIQVSIE